MRETAEVRLTAPFDPVPYSIVGPPEDRGVIGEIEHSGGAYEPDVMNALSRLLQPDAVAFDIGANIGVFAVVMSRLAPRGKVFAFEPAPENFDYLEKNLAANGAGNVVAERCAVFDTTGTVQFVFSPASPSGSFVSPGGEHAPASTPVEAVRLDDYVEQRGLRRVDLIMIDAEGAELAVLGGAERTLAVHRPALLVEVNPVSLRRFGGASYRDLVALLGRDRALYSIGEGGALARIVSDRQVDLLLRKEGVIDLLCLPRRRGRTLGSRARGTRQLAELEAGFDGSTVPANNFLVEPAFALSPPSEKVLAGPGMDLWLTVTVANTGPDWFSSDFLYHPVHVSYRWFDTEGNEVEVQRNRGRFEPPLAPGASQEVLVLVRVPSDPGDYQLSFTLVQESFAWLDDLDPSLRLNLPGTVVPVFPPPDDVSPDQAGEA